MGRLVPADRARIVVSTRAGGESCDARRPDVGSFGGGLTCGVLDDKATRKVSAVQISDLLAECSTIGATEVRAIVKRCNGNGFVGGTLQSL